MNWFSHQSDLVLNLYAIFLVDNLSTKMLRMDSPKTWQKILETLRSEISAANFKAWFQTSTKLKTISEGKISLAVPSAFNKNQLISRYENSIKAAALTVTGQEYLLEFVIEPSSFEKPLPVDDNEDDYFNLSAQSPLMPQTGLNPKFTIENFVVGLTNNLAFAAGQAVAQNPGTTYNPLYIYGPSGVGKTHLMHAIGNAIIRQNPYTKLIYVTSERFMNDLVSAIQNKKTGDFRARYRNCNLLLVDDIQFFAGKDSTQEEFFHTFNDLSTKNAQIILTSDRTPNEIDRLESRLKSRFQGGLMVDIQLPDFDTRVAIMRAKLKERGESLPEEYLKQIADNIDSNTRELEGKLISIIQAAKNSPQGLTPETIQKILGQPSTKDTKLDHKKVLSGINQYFNLKMSDLTGPRRQKEFVLPRQIAMYMLYVECKISMEKVGEILGGRDHTTILHGIGKIREALNRDRDIQRLVIEVKQSLSG